MSLWGDTTPTTPTTATPETTTTPVPETLDITGTTGEPLIDASGQMEEVDR